MDAAAQRDPVRGMCGLNRVRRLRLLAFALLALGLAVPTAATAAGRKDRPPDLAPLLHGYPLDPGAGKIHQRTRTESPATPPAGHRVTKRQNQGGGGSLVPVLAAAGGVLLLVLLGGALLASKRPRTFRQLTKGARMARFIKRRSEEGDASPEIEERIAERITSYPAAPATPAAEAEPVAPIADVDASTQTIATHVQTVLKAAEDAAARMLAEARAKAAEITREAERERASRLEGVETDAARVRAQAEQELAAANAARARAKEEAASIRAEAERDAVAFGAKASAQYEALLDDTAFAEDRLRRLVAGLREVADHLDGLVGAADHSAGVDEIEEPSLVDALEPEGSTANARR